MSICSAPGAGVADDKVIYYFVPRMIELMDNPTEGMRAKAADFARYNTFNREAGEGRRISLRGLGPDFARVQLNGMEVLGNVDSAQDSRGQRSRDRAFDFNIFASELFSRVEVENMFTPSGTRAWLPMQSEQPAVSMRAPIWLNTVK